VTTAAPGLGRVAAVGVHILDVLGRPVAEIPAGQGSARLQEIRATAAGTAAGTAVDLARLGATVTCYGAIGTDLLADILVAALRREGADPSALARKEAAQTSATILPIRANGERPALHVPGASRLLELADIDLRAVAACDAVLLGGPDALTGLSPDDVTAIAAAARAGGALVVVDVLHPGSQQDLARIAGALGLADWFCPNSDQLLALTGRPALPEAITDVLSLGAGGVAVTLGADGCLLTGGDGELVHLPAIDVPVVDTTGCGDGFTAGLMAGLLLGCERVDAAWLGVACGSLVATALGSDASLRGGVGEALDLLRPVAPDTAGRITSRLTLGQTKE
jgi:sugar/nucleoside kinase (ribokinase family)